MKKSLISTLFFFLFLSAAGFAQKASSGTGKLNPSKPVQSAEISCGQCNFKLKGEGCDLAIRINKKAYFVEGAHIDSFGDAHAKMGFCNAIRKAEVQGEVVKDRYKVTYVKLVESPPKQ